jgi:hypothetical protein
VTEYERLLARLAEEAHVYVGLPEIVSHTRHVFRLKRPHAVRRKVLALVRDLLVVHGVIAGGPGPGWSSFVSWDMPVKCALDRIDYEWSALGRDPKLGEIVWFVYPRHRTLIKEGQPEPVGGAG